MGVAWKESTSNGHRPPQSLRRGAALARGTDQGPTEQISTRRNESGSRSKNQGSKGRIRAAPSDGSEPAERKRTRQIRAPRD